MKFVALYRVSSEKQEAQGASLDAQQRRYRELATAHRWETVAEFRGAESATVDARERKLLRRVLETIAAEDVDAIWVYEQSRLTRGDELEVALLMRELRERDVAVWVGTSRIDLSDPSARMAFGITGFVDRQEVERFQERVARGRGEKAKQGKRACAKAPFGYRNPPPGDPRRGTLQVVEEEAAIVRRIFAMAAAGQGRREIARALNAAGTPPPRAKRWANGSVTCILRNRAYLGEAVARAWVRTKDGQRRFDPTNARAIVVPDAHQALIDPSTWEQAHARDGKAGGHPALLTGLLYVDGKRVAIARIRDRNLYRPAVRVSGVGVDAAEADALVWRGVCERLRDLRGLVDVIRRAADPNLLAEIEADITTAERAAGKLRARLAGFRKMRADGELGRTDFDELSGEAGRDLRVAEDLAIALRRQLVAARDNHAEGALRAAAALAAAERKLEPAQRRALLLSIASRIDATILDRGCQTKNEAGHWLPRSAPRWALGDVVLRLRGAGSGAPMNECGRACVTVQIVKDGLVLEPEVRRQRRKRA